MDQHLRSQIIQASGQVRMRSAFLPTWSLMGRRMRVSRRGLGSLLWGPVKGIYIEPYKGYVRLFW